MNHIIKNLTSIMDCMGQSMIFDGNLDLDHVKLGQIEYKLPQGIQYYIALANVGDAIVATGDVVASIEGSCARCLETTTALIKSDIEGYFAISPESNLEGLEEDEYEFIPQSGEVDLTDCVISSVLVEVPTIFLCRQDCKGLCPKCGCNLNTETCNCKDEIDEFNPFFALKDFFDDEDRK